VTVARAALIILITAAAAWPQGVVEGRPVEYTTFEFAGHEEDAQALSAYLERFYQIRSPHFGYGPTLFNKEFLVTSDVWTSGMSADGSRACQDMMLDMFRAIKLDPDGYVNTHQHFSHAHETGWPFPIWTQVPNGPTGVTAGWHFQESGPGWVWDNLRTMPGNKWTGHAAADSWTLQNAESLGIVDGRWHLRSTGESPAIASPEGVEIDSFNAPLLQIRWTRTGRPRPGVLPWVEWMREGDSGLGPDRRVYFEPPPEPEGTLGSCMMQMHTHPKWTGKITRLRICLAPGESGVEFTIDSVFTVYDTRHTINNPVFVLSAADYFRWTHDIGFLREHIDRMRTALRYDMTVMGGLEHKHIVNPWVGHDGRPGFEVKPDGTKVFHPGRGIGNNYWDLLPFGGHDMYATSQYYAALTAMADIEEAALAHPGWNVPGGVLALDPAGLRAHAAEVKADANKRFWSEKTGRFVGWIDSDGTAHDYGFTFVNLDAIWYGIASHEHARAIMDWLDGERIVEGDTSTGADIYRWRFGPRATTRRNVDCYVFVWTGPETIPWGGQVQDGGAVLGFSFYDMWARLLVCGPDDAWRRLSEMLAWDREVQAAGGHREYYKDGKQGTTLQGGGTAGGIGVDFEFYESSLIPSIVARGFVGLQPNEDALVIDPKLPPQCPQMTVRNVMYHGTRMNVTARDDKVTLELVTDPVEPLTIAFRGEWRMQGRPGAREQFTLVAPGTYEFTR